jgi:glutaminyl-tRNA synthetase
MDLDNLPKSANFIEEIIDEDLRSGKHKKIVTRFPPEPNGYLHIGHAKAVSINFGIKAKYGGECNLRFDDTNPVKESAEYVKSIQEDIRWLGYEWDRLLFASDYFDVMFDCAVTLIKKGLAYVCNLSAEEIKNTRGTLTEPGKESPYRNRSVEENLDLFYKMRDGHYADGEMVLRAKIDMASPNMNMRDPVLYRIVRTEHHNTGNKWIIYPMYDFAHPIEDAVEGVTHSCCSLEFEDHRPLYDFITEHCGFNPRPRQIEFARLNLSRTIMSKRFIKQLVDEKVVRGWDDPRLSTVRGMRERGYPPEAIREFCNKIGVAKANSEVDIKMLEHAVREVLNETAARRMVVKEPLRVVIENYPEGKTEQCELMNNPQKPEEGSYFSSFSREIFIEKEDFSLNPPPKYYRLKPGGTVRLKGSYIIEYSGVKLNDAGEPETVFVKFIEDSKSGGANSGIKVKSTIHWVNANDFVPVKLNLYGYLLNEGEGDFFERLNRDSLTVIENAAAERALMDAKPYERFQFLRLGYFMAVGNFIKTRPEFNMTVELKDGYKPQEG